MASGVNARTLEHRVVAQFADDDALGFAKRTEQTDARHLAEVAEP